MTWFTEGRKGDKHMAGRELYLKIKEFESLHLWKYLDDTELFAVKLPSGNIDYCCILGKHSDLKGINIYPGEIGLRCFNDANRPMYTKGEQMFFAVSQVSLQCLFMSTSDLYRDLEAQIRQAEAETGLKLQTPSGWICLEENRDYHVYLPLQQKNEQDMLAALKAAVMIGRLIEKEGASRVKRLLEMIPVNRFNDEIPLFTFTEDHVSKTMLKISREFPPHDYEIAFPDAKLLNQVRKAEAAEENNLEVSLRVTGLSAESPTYPGREVVTLALFSAMGKREKSMRMNPVDSADKKGYRKMLKEFVEDVILPVRPETITVADNQTHALLEDFCERAGIRLIRKRKLSAKFEKLYDRFFNNTKDPAWILEQSGMLDEIARLSVSELRKLPEDILEVLKDLADRGDLSQELAGKIRRI